MSNSNWRSHFAIGALVALLLAASFSLFQFSVSTREQHRQAVAESQEQQSNCQPGPNYLACSDLVAQQGMHRATDALVAQGRDALTLGIVNLVLLIGTLLASVIATLIAARAVKVAREEMENSLQPRLLVKFVDRDWNPRTGEREKVDPLISPDHLPPAFTSFVFQNFGRGPAILNMIWTRHFYANEYPPRLTHFAAPGSNLLPHGLVVQEGGGESERFFAEPFVETARDARPAEHLPAFWFFQGYAIFEGLAGARYLYTFSYYYDSDRDQFELGPDGIEGLSYNWTARFNNKLYRELEVQRYCAAQQ